MIEKLHESHGGVIGFRLTGRVTAEDVAESDEHMKLIIDARPNRPIGIVVDLSQMEGMDWAARWDEMRFLQKYTNHIARIAVVGADKWEEIGAMLVTSAALLQGETLYFHSSEIKHAWHWAKTSKHATEAPAPRHIYTGTGIWKNYTPEFDI